MTAGRLDEAVELAVEATELARAADNPLLLAHALGQTTLNRVLAGDAEGALADAEAALAAARRLANPYVVQMAMASAAFGIGESDPARALVLVRETIALDPRRRHALPLAMAGDLAIRNGEDDEGLEYFAAAIRMMHWQSILFGVGTMCVRVATVVADRDPEAAAILDGAGEALAPGFHHSAGTVAARELAVEKTTSTLGEVRRAELYEQGLAMTGDEAVEYVCAAIDRALSEE